MKLRRVKSIAEDRPSRRSVRAALVLFVCALPVRSQTSSEFPEYQSGPRLSGVIRSWGSDQMGSLMKLWEGGFHKYQPDIYFSDTLKGTATAQFGLHEWVADLAVSARKIYPYEFYGVYRRSLLYPVEIAVASGSKPTTPRTKSTFLLRSRHSSVSPPT